MEIKEFIQNFADQFDETEFKEFQPETVYRELDEWSSLIRLAVLNMIEKKYGVYVTAKEFKCTSTIQELFDLVASKE